jgi:hypothetical protein
MITRKRNVFVEVVYNEKKVNADGKLIEVIAQNAKLAKADAGREMNERVEDWFTVTGKTENCGSQNACPALDAKMFTKNVNLG